MGSAVLLGSAFPQVANAQLFCPGGTFSDGTCAIGNQGAVSTAALSSQALSEASQNVSQVSNDQATNVVRRRLDQERQSAAPAPAAAPGRAAPAARRAAPVRDLKDTMVFKAPPVVAFGPTYAFWGQGFGDYDRWTPDFGATRAPIIGLGLGTDPATVSMKRTTTTFGGLGGTDVTFRANDLVYVFGLLGGYMSSDVKFSSTSVGASNDNSSVSNVKATISGPSVGGYLTFASSAFSADLTAKVDFLQIDQSFNETLFADANPVQNFGSASTRVTNYNIIGNLNYRIPYSAMSWWEPTVGIRATRSDFASDAYVLGLADGSVVRLQGGVRFGSTWDGWYGTTVVTTLTGLVYSDVLVNGLALGSTGITGGFGPLAVAPSEEGLVRGQGILTMNFIHSATASTFIQGEVRGGQDYFGAGGKIGFRVSLN